MGMKYEDLRLAKELVNKISLFASNIQYAESVNEIYDYKKLVLSELDKLVYVVSSSLAKKTEVSEPTPPCCCETCHFLNKNTEDFPYCTARGVSIKNRYITQCKLYECEMPARKGVTTHEVY